MKEIYYATGNSAKYESVYRYLEENVPHLTLKPCNCDFIEIQSKDQKLVAVDKGRQAWEKVQKPVLVDDAGIYFDKYRDFPGVITKQVYEGIGIEGLCKLVKPGDRAMFRLHLVYYHGCNQYETFVGECSGTIVNQADFTVNNDAPYNVIFMPDGSDKTYAQLIYEGEHQSYDYRVSALKKFLRWYTHTGMSF